MWCFPNDCEAESIIISTDEDTEGQAVEGTCPTMVKGSPKSHRCFSESPPCVGCVGHSPPLPQSGSQGRSRSWNLGTKEEFNHREHADMVPIFHDRTAHTHSFQCSSGTLSDLHLSECHRCRWLRGKVSKASFHAVLGHARFLQL